MPAWMLTGPYTGAIWMIEAQTVGIFLPHYNEKHRTILRAMGAGIAQHANVFYQDMRAGYRQCDVAVIFGGVKLAFQPTWLKRPILERHQGRRLLMVESAFVKRGEYYQVGWGGQAGSADFRPPRPWKIDRWAAIGVHEAPWQYNAAGKFVVCGQLPRDTQVQHTDHAAWCRETIKALQYYGLPVTFRPHPKVESASIYGVAKNLIDCRSLAETLADARAVVTYNSTSAVDAVLAGVPTITMDSSSIAWPVTSHKLRPELAWPCRAQWLGDLGYSQWTVDEMAAGDPWRHLTR